VRIGPALPFLSGRGTLLRRVAMLRVKDDGRRPPSGAGRAVTAALLVGIGVTVTALRGPAQTQPAATPAGAANTLPPFDLSLMPRGTNGVFALRPALVIAEAGGQAADDSLALTVKQALANTGFPPDFDLPLSQMEQVVGPALRAGLVEGREGGDGRDRPGQPQGRLVEVAGRQARTGPGGGARCSRARRHCGSSRPDPRRELLPRLPGRRGRREGGGPG